MYTQNVFYIYSMSFRHYIYLHTFLHEGHLLMETSGMTFLKYWCRSGCGHLHTITSVRESDRSTFRLTTTGWNSLSPCCRHNKQVTRTTHVYVNHTGMYMQAHTKKLTYIHKHARTHPRTHSFTEQPKQVRHPQ